MERTLLVITRDVYEGTFDGMVGFVPRAETFDRASRAALRKFVTDLEALGFTVTPVSVPADVAR